MGMPITIEVLHCSDNDILESCFRILKNIDKRFSPYKPKSELSQMVEGVLKNAVSPQMQEVIKACAWFEAQTDGYFSANYNGQFDPSGYVKGWAIQCVADYLKSANIGTFLINAGGDILCSSDTSHVWGIGLQHPKVKHSVMGTISAKNTAVATSGTYERGNHIYNPLTGVAANDLLAVTVIGPDIILADVYATAVFAMGATQGLGFIAKQHGYKAIIVDSDLNVLRAEPN